MVDIVLIKIFVNIIIIIIVIHINFLLSI